MFSAKYSNVINIAKSIKSLQLLIENEIKPRLNDLRTRIDKLQSLSLVFEQMILKTDTQSGNLVFIDNNNESDDTFGNKWKLNYNDYSATLINVGLKNLLVPPTLVTNNYDYKTNVGFITKNIGPNVFNTSMITDISNTTIESQILPFTVENVGINAYNGVKTSYNDEVVPNPPLSCENVKIINVNGFSNISVPNYQLNFQNLQNIQFNAFQGANISEINMNNPGVSVNTIPNNCFENATLGTLMLPTTISYIGVSAFANANIENLYVPLYCQYDYKTSFNGANISNLYVIPGTIDNTPNNPLILSINNGVSIYNVEIADSENYYIDSNSYVSEMLVKAYIKTINS